MPNKSNFSQSSSLRLDVNRLVNRKKVSSSQVYFLQQLPQLKMYVTKKSGCITSCRMRKIRIIQYAIKLQLAILFFMHIFCTSSLEKVGAPLSKDAFTCSTDTHFQAVYKLIFFPCKIYACYSRIQLKSPSAPSGECVQKPFTESFGHELLLHYIFYASKLLDSIFFHRQFQRCTYRFFVPTHHGCFFLL